jgi:hypothetical protein
LSLYDQVAEANHSILRGRAAAENGRFYLGPRRITDSLMNNDQIKLLSLGIISGCGLIATGLATMDAQGACGILTLAFLIWFTVKFNLMKS